MTGPAPAVPAKQQEPRAGRPLQDSMSGAGQQVGLQAKTTQSPGSKVRMLLFLQCHKQPLSYYPNVPIRPTLITSRLIHRSFAGWCSLLRPTSVLLSFTCPRLVSLCRQAFQELERGSCRPTPRQALVAEQARFVPLLLLGSVSILLFRHLNLYAWGTQSSQ